MTGLRSLLRHPLLKDPGLESAGPAAVGREMIRRKGFLRKVYREWYRRLARELHGIQGPIVEIGSGPGFLAEAIPDVVTSDIAFDRSHRMQLDGTRLPFPDGSLGAVVMVNVLHHLPSVELFSREAYRCLRPGGVVAMVEPWVTAWSRLVYGLLHHEPFDTSTKVWGAGPEGNNALPWVVLRRDRAAFSRQCPGLRLASVHPFMPFVFLLSGGTTYRNLAPSCSYGLWRGIEMLCAPLAGILAMFAVVRLEKTG
jgi:SAM-dependent methyltransferase